jgi:hypothetical protein
MIQIGDFHIDITSFSRHSVLHSTSETMAGTTDSVRVAVSQHEPAWLDLAKAVQKTCNIIKEASEAGAKLVAFPECWIPGYPAWIWQVSSLSSRDQRLTVN